MSVAHPVLHEQEQSSGHDSDDGHKYDGIQQRAAKLLTVGITGLQPLQVVRCCMLGYGRLHSARACKQLMHAFSWYTDDAMKTAPEFETPLGLSSRTRTTTIAIQMETGLMTPVTSAPSTSITLGGAAASIMVGS